MNHCNYYLVNANLFYEGMITFQVFCLFLFRLFFLGGGGGGGGGRGGMPDVPHSLGCKATYWLRGISSSFINFTLGVSVVILDGASIVQMLKGLGVITVQ